MPSAGLIDPWHHCGLCDREFQGWSHRVNHFKVHHHGFHVKIDWTVPGRAEQAVLDHLDAQDAEWEAHAPIASDSP